jgi:hypothetical protein
MHHLSLLGQSLHDCFKCSYDFGYQCFIRVIHVLEGALQVFCSILFNVQLRVIAEVGQKVEPKARSCEFLATNKEGGDFFLGRDSILKGQI